jgi:hypothetical protein
MNREKKYRIKKMKIAVRAYSKKNLRDRQGSFIRFKKITDF